ncbi:MAG: glycosyltransferase [Chloroflexota bacterium]
MRIAYFVPYVPSLIRVRPYHLLLQLTKQGIEVVLFTVAANDRELAQAVALRSKLADVAVHKQPLLRSMMNCLVALPTKTPLQSVFSWNPHLQADFTRRAGREEFDLVHVEHLRGSKYGLLINAMFPGMPIVWDSVDCISHLFAQTSRRSRSLGGKLVSLLELKRTQQAEGRAVSLFDHILITSRTDKDALVSLAPNGKDPSPVTILPNGVDLEYFRRDTSQPREAETIVFTGKMSYHANISMVDYLITEIMPKVWAKRPAARVIIVGKDPPKKVREFAKNPLIQITGTVEDIRPYLWTATLAVVPLVYGAGIQNKILEGMASGTPIVTTSAAFSNLQGTPGVDALIADTPEDFAEAILRLIENQGLRLAVGEAGLKYVHVFHDWKQMASRLKGIYQEVITHKRSRSGTTSDRRI